MKRNSDSCHHPPLISSQTKPKRWAFASNSGEENDTHPMVQSESVSQTTTVKCDSSFIKCANCTHWFAWCTFAKKSLLNESSISYLQINGTFVWCCYHCIILLNAFFFFVVISFSHPIACVHAAPAYCVVNFCMTLWRCLMKHTVSTWKIFESLKICAYFVSAWLGSFSRSHFGTRSQIKGSLMTKEEFSFNFILNGIDVSPSRVIDVTPHAKCFSFIIFK